MKTPLRPGAIDPGRLLEVADASQLAADLRAQARTATLPPTVQLHFDLPPPEASALARGVWLHEADDGGAVFVHGFQDPLLAI